LRGDRKIAIDEKSTVRLQNEQAITRGNQLDRPGAPNLARMAIDIDPPDGTDHKLPLPLSQGQSRVIQGRDA